MPSFAQLIPALLAVAFWLGSTSARGEQQMILVTNEQLPAYWVMTERPSGEYPHDLKRSTPQGCVALGFVIGPDGTTSHHRPVAVAPSDVFTKYAVEAADSLRYAPAEENQERQPVFTYLVFTYRIQMDEGANDELKKKSLEEKCDSGALEFFRNVAAGERAVN